MMGQATRQYELGLHQQNVPSEVMKEYLSPATKPDLV